MCHCLTVACASLSWFLKQETGAQNLGSLCAILLISNRETSAQEMATIQETNAKKQENSATFPYIQNLRQTNSSANRRIVFQRRLPAFRSVR